MTRKQVIEHELVNIDTKIRELKIQKEKLNKELDEINASNNPEQLDFDNIFKLIFGDII